MLWCISNRHLHLDGRMGIVVADLKVFGAEIVDLLHLPQDLELGERPDLPLELWTQTQVRGA